MEVETAALAKYMCLVCESSYYDTYTFIYSSSSNTYLIILLLHGNMHIPSLCFALYYIPDFGCCRPKFIFHGELDLNTCSVELPGGVLTMNNLILGKWRIALSINIGVLENH